MNFIKTIVIPTVLLLVGVIVLVSSVMILDVIIEEKPASIVEESNIMGTIIDTVKDDSNDYCIIVEFEPWLDSLPNTKELMPITIPKQIFNILIFPRK